MGLFSKSHTLSNLPSRRHHSNANVTPHLALRRFTRSLLSDVPACLRVSPAKNRTRASPLSLSRRPSLRDLKKQAVGTACWHHDRVRSPRGRACGPPWSVVGRRTAACVSAKHAFLCSATYPGHDRPEQRVVCETRRLEPNTNTRDEYLHA